MTGPAGGPGEGREHEYKAFDLIPENIRQNIPKLYETDNLGDKATVHVKLFCGGWTWYVTEFDGEDQCFGLVDGFEKELGYFSLKELESIRVPVKVNIEGLREVQIGEARVERDIHFQPKTLAEVKEEMDS